MMEEEKWNEGKVEEKHIEKQIKGKKQKERGTERR
jgi:hypothetical protein